MKSAAKNIQLASYDDLFKTDEERQADAQERVQNLPLDKLEPFPNHPFKVIDDDKMLETVESIKERGVLAPPSSRQPACRSDRNSGYCPKYGR